MKTTKEIAENVFRRRDAYFAQQRERNRTIRQVAVIGTSVCGCGILAVSGLHFRKVREPLPAVTPAETTIETTAAQQTVITQTTAYPAATAQTTVTSVRQTEMSTLTEMRTTRATEGSSALQTAPVTAAVTELPVPATAAQTQIVTVQTTAAPVMTTEPVHYQTAAIRTAEPAPAVTETQTEAAETQTEPAVQPETRQLDGFLVEQYPDHQKIVCTDEFPAPDGRLQSYLVLSDSLTVRSMSEPEPAERTYEIECPEAGKTFTVTQREYADFALTVDEGELIDISLNRAHGFFHLNGDTCSLYWFRDGEGFFVSGDTNDLVHLMKIARSFTPADET